MIAVRAPDDLGTPTRSTTDDEGTGLHIATDDKGTRT